MTNGSTVNYTFYEEIIKFPSINGSGYVNESTMSDEEIQNEAFQWIITAIYSAIFVIGMVGNCLVITVVLKERSMRNVANYFLVSLSSADLMIIFFCLPVAVWDAHGAEWIFGLLLCKLIPYAQHLSVNASILTILSISFERLFAVCLPFKARTYCTKRKALSVITAVWLLCAVTSLPALFLGQIVELEADPDGLQPATTICLNVVVGYEWYVMLEVSALYATPGGVLIVVYLLIIRTLRKQLVACPLRERRGNSRLVASLLGNASMLNLQKVYGRQKSRRQLIFMLAAVVATYFVCLLPFNVITTLAILAPDLLTDMPRDGYEVFLTVARLLFFVNSCVNPLLYNVISGKFRSAFLRLFGFRRNFHDELSTNSSRMSVTNSTIRRNISLEKRVRFE